MDKKKIDDAGLKELLTRVRDHEKYHIDVFKELLKDEEKSKIDKGSVWGTI